MHYSCFWLFSQELSLSVVIMDENQNTMPEGAEGAEEQKPEEVEMPVEGTETPAAEENQGM